jgi:Flp pilus assembly protein TadB
MRRRLYYLLPSVEAARRTANDLLLARVEDRHMRFLASRNTDLGELHEAGYLQKTDMTHGAGLGFALGGLGGIAVGALFVAYPPESMHLQLGVVLVAAIVGALLGLWLGSMAAAAVPNSRLKQFQDEIAHGKVLLMLDVPHGRVDEFRDLLQGRHPEAVSGGQETRFPAFP